VSAAGPGPVTVRIWGEGRAEKMLPSIIRVLVAGQHGGAIQRTPDGWEAQVHGIQEGWRDASEPTTHDTAAEAVQAILRSSWGRKLGARAASRVYWSDRAARLAAKASPKAER
jgi:hypothetical protein